MSSSFCEKCNRKLTQIMLNHEDTLRCVFCEGVPANFRAPEDELWKCPLCRYGNHPAAPPSRNKCFCVGCGKEWKIVLYPLD